MIYKNGNYIAQTKRKPIFDLKEVEKNAKKGLKYKKIVLKAMLFEEILFKKSVNRYNNIAYYFQKAGHNKEAVFLLEQIINMFPKRMVAYYNLGDAYWALGEKKKLEYMKMMKAKGKEKRIPKVVKDRVLGN